MRLAVDGTLSLTVTLPFEAYLEGIAEVPPSWPAAALQAQAIAAHSYALATSGWRGQLDQVQAGDPSVRVGDPVVVWAWDSHMPWREVR